MNLVHDPFQLLLGTFEPIRDDLRDSFASIVVLRACTPVSKIVRSMSNRCKS